MTTAPTTIQGRIALPSSSGFAGGPPTASDIVAMLRRRMVLIVVLFIVFLGLSIGGFAVWWLYYPGYRSECLIECISNIPETQITIKQNRLRQDEHERFVQTQALLLKSSSILGEALKINAVRETNWYQTVKRRGLEPLLELTDDLGSAAVRGTNFLRVVMECRVSDEASVIINEVVNQWYHIAKKRSSEEFASEALSAAQKELDDLQLKVGDHRDRLKAIARRLPAGAIQNPGGNISHQQVQQHAQSAALLELELSQLDQFRSIYNDPVGVAATAEDRMWVEQDPQVAQLAQFVFQLEQQRAADEGVFGLEHGLRKQLDASIDAAEEKLAQLRLEKLSERRADMREAANSAYDNTRYALFLEREKLQQAEAQLQDQDRMLFDYLDLQAKLEADTQYSQKLEDYVRSLSRVKTRRTAINISIAQPAIPALERNSPTLLLMPMGFFLSIAMSVGIALGLEFLDKSVRTIQDLERHLDIAILGAIPDVDDEEVSINQVETAVADTPQSMVSEAFRRIRTNLQFNAPVDRQKSIMVTSPLPDDGKTTVACNLAMAVAQGGRRVLLVDANFRRPALQKFFKQIPSQGLSNILISQGSFDSLVAHTDVPNLDVLGCGPIPPNPVELLGGESFRTFIEKTTAAYDQVIIDTAPVLLASDAVVVATSVDGVILTIRANQNSRGVARRALTLLTDVNARMFGAVLNAARVRRGGYFREQLRSFYDYQADADYQSDASAMASKPQSTTFDHDDEDEA